MTEKKNIWEELRKPFPQGTVGLLPKLSCKDCSDSSTKACDRHPKSKCKQCDNWISSAHIHLDYVGHAAVTDRLNNVVGADNWSWEFVAVDESGNPKLDVEKNLWIRLTVDKATRLGVGDGKNMKERIGDALRNAAMRFGIALDLWTKDELESTLEDPEMANSKPTLGLTDPTTAQLLKIKTQLSALEVYDDKRDVVMSQVTTSAKADEMIAELDKRLAARKEPKVEPID